MSILTSLQHPLIKHLVKLRKNSDYRYEHRRVVLEGIKPVTEVCAIHPAKLLIVQEGIEVSSQVRTESVMHVSEAVMNKVSGMEKSEGLLAELEMPKAADLHKARYVLVLDGVSDPGNMGALLRTAQALNWEGVFIVDNGCDPFNDKALRAARGATFKLPLKLGTQEELQEWLNESTKIVIVADIKGHSPAAIKDKDDGMVLVLGNEARGSLLANKYERVSIPMPGDMESLNVAIAGGILMYVLKWNLHE